MAPELLPNQTGILVIDYQTRLAGAMPETVFNQSVTNTSHLLTLAQRLALPVVVTEQYPQGLGATVDTLQGLIPSPFAKTTFDALADPTIFEAVDGLKKDHWIVVGMETHICVYQTARHLVNRGHEVWLPQDAVVSRTRQNWSTGVSLMSGLGVNITCTEATLFDLLKEAKGEAFKETSRLIR